MLVARGLADDENAADQTHEHMNIHDSTKHTANERSSADIDETSIGLLVDRFYDKVRADPALGPVFNRAIHDWPAHKLTLTRFWSSMVLRTGTYRGNPMAVHRALPAFPKELFHQWLSLWRETVRELFSAPADEPFIDAAERVAQGLSLGLNLGSLGDTRSRGALAALRIVGTPPSKPS